MTLPAVSIILPTYNRAGFLPDALACIRGQTFSDWELIIVDDGSTDDTARVVKELMTGGPQPVQYIYQANQGPAHARNRGIDEARAPLLAFFDSDDRWLPHHLERSVEALRQHQDVHWIFAATRIVEYPTGRVLEESAFYDQGTPRAILGLQVEQRGGVNVLVDARVVEVAIRDALNAGLQTSVIRRTVFEPHRLPGYRVGEDQVFAILTLKRGYRLGYLDSVNVIYHVHEESISSGPGKGWEQRVKANQELIRAFESLLTEVRLDHSELQALRARLNVTYFWNVGYVLMQHGRYAEGRRACWRGLRLRPATWGQWKTYLASFVREFV